MTKEKLRIFHSEDERDFLAWLGLYITTWSAAEHSLFMSLKTLSFITGDKFEHKPIALTAKLKLFRRALNHPLLQDELKESEALLDFMKSESDFRHSIIHGLNARFLLPNGRWYNEQWMPERFETPTDDHTLIIDQKTLEDHYHQLGRVIFAFMGLNRKILEKAKELIENTETTYNK